MAPVKSTNRSVHFSPKHAWREEDRLLLILFFLCFQNHIADFTKIFNYIHRQKLSKEGFFAGMPATSMVAQLHEFKNGGTGSRLFAAIRPLSLNQLHEMFAEQLQLIEETAHRFGIELLVRIHHDASPTGNRLGATRRSRAVTETSATSITTWQPDPNEIDEHYTPTRRDGTSVSHPKTTFLPIMVSTKSTNAAGPKHPYFLYRAFEVNHGFVARRYLGTEDNIPVPPRFKSRLFEHEVRPHLDRDKSYSSPFISFAQNPAVAIKHARNQVGSGRMIALAILKYDDLRKDAITRFGPDSGPYLTPTICRQHELWDLPGSYTGTGEWLVWGSVNCTPVAVIPCFETLMIRAIVRTTFLICANNGGRLSRYLPKSVKNLDPEHFELFLYQLLTGFKIPGFNRARKTSAYLEYVRAAMTPPGPDLDLRHVRKSAQESDSDSDVEIIGVRSCNANRVTLGDWRSDTTSAEVEEW